MSDVLLSLRNGTHADRDTLRPLGIFKRWRLQACGYSLAVVNLLLLVDST